MVPWSQAAETGADCGMFVGAARLSRYHLTLASTGEGCTLLAAPLKRDLSRSALKRAAYVKRQPVGTFISGRTFSWEG